jgi:8-oxo-dGTP pyrophosphatase MutT (NUDIX family)
MVTLTDIERALAEHTPALLTVQGATHAAVSLVINAGPSGLRILFIERAVDDRDPWSGHISFPGGKVENGDGGPRETAERETMEEIGLDLHKARCLGRLSDISGARIPVLVSCFVYHIQEDGPFDLSDEVQDAFWVSLDYLMDSSNHGEKRVRFDGATLPYPGIDLPQQGKPALWGLTYRLVTDFIELIRT